MRIHLAFAIAIAAAIIAMPATAIAEPGLEIGAGSALSAGTFGSVNAGEQAGVASGGGTDLVGRRLGIDVSAAIASESFAVGLAAGISLGGLDLSRVEQEYYGATGQLGGSSVVFAALEGRAILPGAKTWRPFGALALGVERMSASSDVGAVHIDARFIEPRAGVRYDLSPTVAGGARLDIAVAVRLARVTRATLSNHPEASESPPSPAMFAVPTVSVRYRYAF